MPNQTGKVCLIGKVCQPPSGRQETAVSVPVQPRSAGFVGEGNRGVCPRSAFAVSVPAQETVLSVPAQQKTVAGNPWCLSPRKPVVSVPDAQNSWCLSPLSISPLSIPALAENVVSVPAQQKIRGVCPRSDKFGVCPRSGFPFRIRTP